MANHSTGDQVTYVQQWFNTWSDYQREDFIHCMASKVASEPLVNGITNGFQSLDTSGRPPTLFACQVKLFNDWWPNWSEEDRERFTTFLKENTEFWKEVEAEVSGSRRKIQDDFFIVPEIMEGSKKAGPKMNGVEVAEEAVEQEVPKDVVKDEALDEEATSINGSNSEQVVAAE